MGAILVCSVAQFSGKYGGEKNKKNNATKWISHICVISGEVHWSAFSGGYKLRFPATVDMH